MDKELKDEHLFTYGPASELLDAVNVRLLRELRCDPRLTMTELGRRVSMSSPAVTERVRRLEEAGIIAGYRVVLDPASLGFPVCAFVRVRPAPGQLAKVIELAQRMPQVVECHRVTGEDCFILKVLLPAMDQLDRLLDRFLLHGVTTTSIIQSSPVPPRLPPLPDLSAPERS